MYHKLLLIIEFSSEYYKIVRKFMKVTTKLDQKAVTSANLARSEIASMQLQIQLPVIDWKEAKVMGTHAHYHQRFLIEPCHTKSTSP